jgi:hypothetical protein
VWENGPWRRDEQTASTTEAAISGTMKVAPSIAARWIWDCSETALPLAL